MDTNALYLSKQSVGDTISERFRPTFSLTMICRKKIAYEKGLRTEKALAGQAEIDELKKARQNATKKAKKAKKARTLGTVDTEF